MAIIGTFDGANKRVSLSTDNIVSGTLRFNAADFLGELIDWRNGPSTAPYNDRWIRPIRAVGGDSKGGNLRVGTSVFLMHDWQVAFPDQTLRVVIDGELLLDQATNTNGQRFYYGNLSPSSRVTVELATPTFNEVITVSSTGTSSASFTTDDRAKLTAINSNVNILLTRLTDQRAANLDDVPTLLSRLTTARAAALDLIQGLSNRALTITKALGREPGVSVTQLDPTDDAPGYLRTSDDAIRQTITKNSDGSVTVENE